jgi:hypothetical protein
LLEIDVANVRFAQRHERALVDMGAPILRLRVAHDLPRIADRFQIASHDLIEGRSFWPRDLDDSISWLCERRLGDIGGNVIRRNRLK